MHLDYPTDSLLGFLDCQKVTKWIQASNIHLAVSQSSENQAIHSGHGFWRHYKMNRRKIHPKLLTMNVIAKAGASLGRCNGVLKMRFRCLLKHRVLHYAPTMASKIINACTVLHNMCIKNNLPNVEEDLEDVDYGMFLAPQQAEVQDVAVGKVNPQLADA
ncbi:hypothetical protein CBL_10099 [Carabus blaptoides fortunei]